MSEERTYKYTIRKAGEKPEGVDCVHLARSKAEERKAQLWRNLPDRSYMVTDYGKEPEDGEAKSPVG